MSQAAKDKHIIFDKITNFVNKMIDNEASKAISKTGDEKDAILKKTISK